MKSLIFKLDKKRILEVENKLIRSKENFTVEQTNYTIRYVLSDRAYLFSSGYLGIGGLKIISQVKADIKKNLQENKFQIKDVKPIYYGLNEKNLQYISGELDTVTELDLNHAYITSAYIQKIISKKTYMMLQKISKGMRLRALGSIATNKSILIYEGGKLVSRSNKENKDFTNIWRMICAGVGEMMHDLIYEYYYDNFLFFWVDNLYIKGYASYYGDLLKVKYPVKLKYERNKDLIKFVIDDNRLFTIPLKLRQMDKNKSQFKPEKPKNELINLLSWVEQK